MFDRFSKIEEMIGVTMASVTNIDDECLMFEDTDGVRYSFFHTQDCCESVYIEDICGDLDDLVGSPLVEAEVVVSECGCDEDHESDQVREWTFYKFGTAKGFVTVRWMGSSNGFYSTGVSFHID